MLSMERRRDWGGFSHTCGAALLTPRWVLSAAHCLDSMPSADDYRILVGAFNISADDQVDTFKIKTIKIHEGWTEDKTRGYPNDIAVAELDREVDITHPDVGLAQLPRRGDSFHGNDDCWATGWGRYDPDETFLSPVLKEMHAAVHPRSVCQTMWETLYPGWGTRILDQHVCIAGPDDGVCHGDSGSPLNCDVTGKGDWVVAGVASWASGERCIGATGVYAGVEPFLDWLRDNVPGLPGNKP